MRACAGSALSGVGSDKRDWVWRRSGSAGRKQAGRSAQPGRWAVRRLLTAWSRGSEVRQIWSEQVSEAGWILAARAYQGAALRPRFRREFGRPATIATVFPTLKSLRSAAQPLW